MQTLADAIVGSLELLRLGVLSRFRVRGAYWTWRLHTAFGSTPPPRARLLREALRFGCWARRMRRL